MDKSAIIYANGEKPSDKVIKFIHSDNALSVCTDGALHYCRALNIAVQVLIGDLDSVSNEELAVFPKSGRVIKFNRQDDTDLEKALRFLLDENYSQVTITGAVGKRFDHTLANLSLLIKYMDCFSLCIVTNHSVLYPVKNEQTFYCTPGEIVSFYGFMADTRVTTNGLAYPLDDEIIVLGERDSTSNVTTGDSFTISTNDRPLIVVRQLNSLIRMKRKQIFG
ncbi:MAG: thiamine diphosphokinase [Ignavibacteria bacterium]|nr:thiamine diphosphokinase [Ignavibacteria bacterium]